MIGSLTMGAEFLVDTQIGRTRPDSARQYPQRSAGLYQAAFRAA